MSALGLLHLPGRQAGARDLDRRVPLRGCGTEEDDGGYGHSERAAIILMVKGAHAYGAVIGGARPKPGDRAALRKLVTALAAKA